MTVGLAGGLALFLYGMERMAGALKVVAGNRMRSLLASLTTNRFSGVLTGAGVTAVLQSSSVTTVMLVGFVSAGFMSLSQAIGVVLGANIGTTITAQIIAFKVTKYSLILVAVGFVPVFVARRQSTRQYGYLIMGLGLIFFGMSLMSSAMRPLRSHEGFIALMRDIDSPVFGVLVAAAFTGLVQSSSATTGVVIAMATQGLVSLDNGIALLLGANIGTCVTAGLAAIGKPREAVRVSVAHVAFNLAGAMIAVWFIPQFAEVVRDLSPAAAGDLGATERLAADAPRQIANAHTLFNIAFTIIFLPLASLLARFCEWVVPDRGLGSEVLTKHLQPDLVSAPGLALAAARAEIGRMGKRVHLMVEAAIPAVLSGSHDDLDEVCEMDDEVDGLYGEIVLYLGEVSKQQLADDQTHELVALLDAANALENIGDVVETDLVASGLSRIERGFEVSEATSSLITAIGERLAQSVRLSVASVAGNDKDMGRQVDGPLDEEISRQLVEAARHGAQRLIADAPHRLPAYAMESDVFDQLGRIAYFAKRAARTVSPKPPSGARLPSGRYKAVT